MVQWKDIEGFEGFYQVSDNGQVRSVCRTVLRGKNFKPVNERILKPYYNNRGYAHVALSRRGNLHTYSVHRLVAQAFIPNPNNYPCVNHKDENPKNNCVDNLEWCTYEYNNTYNGLAKRRMLHVNFAKRKANTNWELRKLHTDFVKRTQNTDYKSIGLKHRKEVYQYSLSGELIKKWNCVTDVADVYKCSPDAIRMSCLGKCKTTKGFIWRYKNDVKNI